MKKIFVEAYMEKNFGDDLFLEILFDRYKNIQWTINTYNKEYLNIFSKYKTVKIINRYSRKLVQLMGLQKIYYHKYDALINIGGSIFIESFKWDKLYNYRNNQLRGFIDKPKYIIGANFGPFKTSQFYDNYKKYLANYTDVCFRDQYSLDMFQELSNVRIAADVIFGLRYEGKKKIKKSIGISLIELENRENLKAYADNYYSKMVQVIEEYIEKQYSITLFSFCEFQGDLNAIKKVVSKIKEQYRNKINIINYDGNIQKFLDEFSSMEIIIGTRFHACVLSQKFNQGLYPIIYDQKTMNLIKDINLDSFYCDIKEIKDFDVKKLVDVIDMNKIDNINDLQINAEKQFYELDKFLFNEE